MKTYACVRTDNMSGTVEGKDLVSLKYEGEIENGTVVLVGDYLDGEREVREATIPGVDAELSMLALVATPEVIKSKTYHSIANYVNEEGTTLRGYRLTQNGIFSVTAPAFAEGVAPAVGNIVELDGAGKFLAVESATEGSTTIGKVVLIEGEWYVIEIA